MKHVKLFESFDIAISPEEFEAEIDKAIAMDNHLDTQAHIRKTISDNPGIRTNRKFMMPLKKMAAWADSLTPEQQDEMRAAAAAERGDNAMLNPVPAPQNKYQPMGNQSDYARGKERQRVKGIESAEAEERAKERESALASLNISPEELEAEIDKAVGMGNPEDAINHMKGIILDNPGIKVSASHVAKLGKFTAWMLGK